VLRVALPASAGIPGGYLLLSEAPAQGPAVLPRVAGSSLFAGVLAVIVAALVGYLLARRISRPLVDLTHATDRMAGGDLTVRADVAGSEEMQQLGESFNTMVAQTGATMDALRRFVADAAHELGTPLTAVQTDVQLAARAESLPDARRLAARAFGQAQRLRAVTSGLLELSRIEGGAEHGHEESADLAAAIHVAVEAVASRAEQAGLNLEMRVPPGELMVLADRSRLDAIVLNLLGNAVKFTPEGGTVGVTAGAEAAGAIMTVWDTGIGIPAGERDRVFSRFHRTAEASGIPGSGLGLAIVTAAVESAGGTIVIEDSPVGTRFSVRLPLACAL
jgi:signal transduction histidine kinase